MKDSDRSVLADLIQYLRSEATQTLSSTFRDPRAAQHYFDGLMRRLAEAKS